MATTTAETTANRTRSEKLRKMLADHLYALTRDVQGKIRDARVDNINERHVVDDGETSELDVQDDIEFALIQMKAETLSKIDTVLRRLEEGAYGHCFDCGNEIAEPRLRALPFAVRCKDCEEVRELAIQRERSVAQRRYGSALLFD
jgi:DnaK suppressor protein